MAATATQCYIYSTANFNTPHIVDLAQPPHLLLQCERCILLVDAAAGMQVRGRLGNGLACTYGACLAWPLQRVRELHGLATGI